MKPATTLHDVRLQLAREEASDMAAGISPLHQTTLTSFLTMALDLEEQQCVSYHLYSSCNNSFSSFPGGFSVSTLLN